MSERAKAFDTKAYLRSPQGFAGGLASLALESGSFTPNYYELVVTPDGKVVDPNHGSIDVIDQLRWDSQLEIVESGVSVERRLAILNDPDGTLCVWVSPPGGPGEYNEGRLDVGYIRTLDDGTRFHEGYGIRLPFDGQECLLIGSRIGEFAQNSWPLESPEDLREKLFRIRTDAPWELLGDVIPLPQVWDEISSGMAKLEKEKAIRLVEEKIAPVVLPHIRRAVTEFDHLSAGALAERMMMREGYCLQDNGCGDLNTKLLQMNRILFISSTVEMSSDGRVLLTRVQVGSAEGSKYVKNCGKCGKRIEAVITKGYKCECGGVYEGC